MSAFTEDMLKSMAKVEATRAQRLHASIERFTAEEKDELLKEFHPDYSSKGFKVLVALPQGTNVGTCETEGKSGEDKLLRMTNKWLLAHPEAPEAKDGAWVGLEGVNIDIADSI